MEKRLEPTTLCLKDDQTEDLPLLTTLRNRESVIVRSVELGFQEKFLVLDSMLPITTLLDTTVSLVQKKC